MADIRDYVDAAELRSLYMRQPARLVRDGVGIWLAILLAMTAAILSGSVFVTLIAFVVIAGRQHALNNMVHEGSHYLLARDKELNDLISDVFFAAPHLISTAGYRAKHLPHHQHLGHPPEDGEFKARFLFRGSRAFWRSLWILLGGSSLLTAAEYGQGIASNLRVKTLIVLTNGLLLLYCWMLGSAWAYLYLWLLPLLTLTGYLATLRVVAEHQPVSYARLPTEDFDSPLEPPLTRSIPAGRVARFFLAPLNFCYHFEHHAFPAVPYTSLPRLHHLLKERGFFRAHPEALGATYGRVLLSLVRPDWQSDPRDTDGR
jgi:fatty acid desaturase